MTEITDGLVEIPEEYRPKSFECRVNGRVIANAVPKFRGEPEEAWTISLPDNILEELGLPVRYTPLCEAPVYDVKKWLEFFGLAVRAIREKREHEMRRLAGS